MEYNAMVEQKELQISAIRVATKNNDYFIPEIIEQSAHEGGCVLKDSGSGRELSVLDRAHAESLIRGMQKAIDLGWV